MHATNLNTNKLIKIIKLQKILIRMVESSSQNQNNNINNQSDHLLSS